MSSSEIESIWNQVQPVLGGSGYTVGGGETSKTLLVPDGQEGAYVAKFAPVNDTSAVRRLLREAAIARLVHGEMVRISNSPLLHVPGLLHVAPDKGWAAFSMVPETVLTPEEIRGNLTPADRKSYAWGLGRFIGLFAEIVDPDRFKKEIDDRYGEAPFNRERQLRQLPPNAAQALRDRGHPLLATALDELGRERKILAAENPLPSHSVTHGDLHPWNVTSKQVDGKWQFFGAFDMGNAQIEPPATQLRCIPFLDATLIPDAIAGYKSVTGEDIPPALVLFYHRMQSVAGCTKYLQTRDTLPSLYLDYMQTAYPEAGQGWVEEFSRGPQQVPV